MSSGCSASSMPPSARMHPCPKTSTAAILIYRVCLGCWQVLEARPDGHEIKMRREPPASDWPAIWARLNQQWRNRNS